MKSTFVTQKEALHLIGKAREAELCRDIDLLKDILFVVWEDIEEPPNYSEFEDPIRAELLRLSGFLLSQYGKSHGLTEYQMRAKDLLTVAIELFQGEDDRTKAAEASIAMAVAYWFAGEVVECDSILNSVEEEFTSDCNYSIMLAVKLNRIGCLTWLGQFETAIEIIEAFGPLVELCPDLKLQAQFHNHAGIIYRKMNLIDKSIFHLRLAIEISKKFKSYRFQGLSMNCLAMTFRDAGDYASAHLYISEALSVFETIGDTGWVPNVLDTRALILLDEGRVEEAMETIDQAVALFSESEDYSGWTEAMFTKCRCLLRLGRTPEALDLFAELGHLASVKIGEAALRKYSKMLAAEVRYVEGKSLRERTDFLKKELIREALLKSGGNIVEAAAELGESHQALSFILKTKYSELYKELGITRRPRTVKPKASEVETENTPVQHVLMPESMKYAYDFHVEEEASDISIFLLSRKLTEKLGLNAGKLVAVAKLKEPKSDTVVLYDVNGEYDIGRLIHDNLSNLFGIEKEEGNFVFLTDVSLVGVPIGYCEPENLNRNLLEFRKIEI